MFADFHQIHHRSEFCPSHWSSGYAIQPSYGHCRSTGYGEIASPEGRHTSKHTICMYRVRHSELHDWKVHFIGLSKNCGWIEAFIVSPLGMVCGTASCFYFQCACVQLPLRQKKPDLNLKQVSDIFLEMHDAYDTPASFHYMFSQPVNNVFFYSRTALWTYLL